MWLQSRGFTLAEILVATAGFLALALALIVVNLTTVKTLSIVSAKTTLTTTLQTATEQFQRDINRAKAPVVASCGVTYVASPGNAAAAGRLLLDAPGVGPGAADRLIYLCEPLSGCIASSPGVLWRIAANSDTSCVPIREQRVVARDVTRFSYETTAGSSDVRVRLGVRKEVARFVATSTIVVGYNFRNRP